jgi:hypothetical protein
MFSLTTLPVHCCSYCIYRRDIIDRILYPRNIASKVAYIAEYYCWYVRTECTGKSFDNLKLPTVLFVELNITMALGVLMERDFIGASVAQSCGCETAERDPSPRLRSFSVTPCSLADTA